MNVPFTLVINNHYTLGSYFLFLQKGRAQGKEEGALSGLKMPLDDVRVPRLFMHNVVLHRLTHIEILCKLE